MPMADHATGLALLDLGKDGLKRMEPDAAQAQLEALDAAYVIEVHQVERERLAAVNARMALRLQDGL
jgi:hypothetical protein